MPQVTHCSSVFGIWSSDYLTEDLTGRFNEWAGTLSKRLDIDFQITCYSNYLIGCNPIYAHEDRAIPSTSATLQLVEEDLGSSIPPGRRTSRNVNPAQGLVHINGRSSLNLTRGTSGAQTLYYKTTSFGVFFTSDLRHLNRLGLKICQSAVQLFLHFFYIPAPQTIYKDVHAILPGGTVVVNEKGLETHRQSEGSNRHHDGNRADDYLSHGNLDTFEQHLVSALDYSLSGSNRTALLLSGGKDSSALAIAARGHPSRSRIEAVTIGFHDRRVDEVSAAAEVARACGIDHMFFRFREEEYLSAWKSYIDTIGQPMGDPAAFPLHLFLKESDGEYDNILDGTGNDSYFGLAPTGRGRELWYLRRVLGPVFDHILKLIQRLGLLNLSLEQSSTLSAPREEQFVSWRGFPHDSLRSHYRRALDLDNLELTAEYNASRSPAEHLTRTICGIWEPEAAYRKMVQQSEKFHLRATYPFLEPELASFVRSLPKAARLQSGQNKVILRRFLERHLPKSITQRPKGSFIFPREFLFDPNANSDFKALAEDEELVNPEALPLNLVEKALSDFQAGIPGSTGRLYSVFLLHSWLESERSKTSCSTMNGLLN